MELFQTCPRIDCQAAIDAANVEWIEKGAWLRVKYTCNNSHSGSWDNSPVVGQGKSKIGILNILLATYTLLCGLHVSQVS